MQLFKLNALTLLLIINKKHKYHISIENFKNRNFYCLKIIIIENCNN